MSSTPGKPWAMEYADLIARVDEIASRLFAHYQRHVACRRGCYFCCDEIDVLPIEFEALRRRLEREGHASPRAPQRAVDPDRPERLVSDRTASGVFSPPGRSGRRCVFLSREGACTVYEARPLVCRTHGLPLSYAVEEYDAAGNRVRSNTPELVDLWCDLNFTTVPGKASQRFFDENGRVRMDLLNDELEKLNERFLATPEGARYRGAGRLPLRALLFPEEQPEREHGIDGGKSD